MGLLFAFDFENDTIVNNIVNYAKEHGVICYWFLSNPYSFRIAPPLTITEAEIKKACAVILDAIEQA
jgi:acetylornithine/succinyldiaminopimelate/putrescine aminotransferase